MFVDKTAVTFRAGRGGDGVTSFRHEKFRHRGGPDGGDGGDGGDIILVATRNLNTLATFRYKKLLHAEDGSPGGRRKKHGKSGQNLVLAVPVGTVVVQDDDNAIADLTKEAQEVVIAGGGKGGYGNAHFASSTRQVPRVSERGEKGEELHVTLELKMIADVGIIGLPNAGKSTLLSVISNAKPEIADYPFTTLKPNLGVVDIDKKNSLLFADIPGLIEGASKGKGLGDEFLRHIERTNVLLHLIDAYTPDIKNGYKEIMSELAAYKIDLSGKPQIVAITKVEGLENKKKQQLIKSIKKLVPKNTIVVAISARSKEGVDKLLRDTLAIVTKTQKVSRAKAKKVIPIIGLRPSPSNWEINKQNGIYVITGTSIERFASRTRFGDEYGEQRLMDILKKQGILKELEKKGINSDQKIQIGDPAIGTLVY